MAIKFINADLEIYSQVSLSNLHQSFMREGDRIWEMHQGKLHGEESYFYSYEIELGIDANGKWIENFPENYEFGAEHKIVVFLDVIEKFAPASVKEWKRADRRVIDLGYRADNHCATLSDSLPSDILAKMAAYTIDLAFTYYPENLVC